VARAWKIIMKAVFGWWRVYGMDGILPYRARAMAYGNGAPKRYRGLASTSGIIACCYRLPLTPLSCPRCRAHAYRATMSLRRCAPHFAARNVTADAGAYDRLATRASPLCLGSCLGLACR